MLFLRHNLFQFTSPFIVILSPLKYYYILFSFYQVLEFNDLIPRSIFGFIQKAIELLKFICCFIRWVIKFLKFRFAIYSIIQLPMWFWFQFNRFNFMLFLKLNLFLHPLIKYLILNFPFTNEFPLLFTLFIYFNCLTYLLLIFRFLLK